MLFIVRKRTKRTFALFIDAFIELIKPQLQKTDQKQKVPKIGINALLQRPIYPPPGTRPGGGEATSFQIFFYFFIFLLLWNKFATKMSIFCA